MFINKKHISRELLIVVNNLGIITEATSNCFDILGYTISEMQNTNISKYLNSTFDDLILMKNLNVEILRKDEVKLFFDMHITPLTINNKIENIILSLFDITKNKALENTEKITLKIFECTKDIVCRFELLPEIKFTYLSKSVEDITGYSVEEHIQNPMLAFEITHPDDKEAQFSKINSKTDFSKLIQVRMKHKNGYYVWLEDYLIPEYNKNGQLVAVQTISRNIQERKELEQRLEKLGYHDNLTGLFNKNYLLKEMNLLDSKINIPVGIIVCDLDNLKLTNDSLGHSVGDDLIIHAGKMLLSVFNNEHMVSRMGGDEFVIIIKNKSYDEVNEFYNKLKMAIKQYNESNNDIPIKISIGLAYTESSLNKMQYILDIADSEMYRDKKQKRN